MRVSEPLLAAACIVGTANVIRSLILAAADVQSRSGALVGVSIDRRTVWGSSPVQIRAGWTSALLPFTRRSKSDGVQSPSLKASTVIAGATALLALVAGVFLDGFTFACNESLPPQCTGFHVAWPVLFSVALATLVLLVVAMRLSTRSHARWGWLLLALGVVGAVTSWVLALRTAVSVG
jgi:hypothetical protein